MLAYETLAWKNPRAASAGLSGFALRDGSAGAVGCGEARLDDGEALQRGESRGTGRISKLDEVVMLRSLAEPFGLAASLKIGTKSATWL